MLPFKLETPHSKRQWLECVALALIYVATARLGQLFAMEPGNITPVWLPSGICLAYVLIRGEHTWPGIFIGAVVGNGWAYIDITSFAAAGPGLFAAFTNGVGDVACTLLAAKMLIDTGTARYCFSNLISLRVLMIYGVILGPLISASLGVGSLVAADIVPLADATTALLTWWLGGGVGVLLLTPAILAFWHTDADSRILAGRTETTLFLCLCLVFPVTQYFATDHELVSAMSAYMILPVLFWGILRLGIRAALLTAMYYVAVDLIMAQWGKGYFWQDSSLEAIVVMQFFILICMSSILIVAALVHEREELVAVLRNQTLIDNLTGINNRHAIEEQIRSELRLNRRYRQNFSLIMFDIDRFKAVNDHFGHQQGDDVLKRVAAFVRDSIRDADTVARWGGEEFMVLLPECDVASAVTCAENLCAGIAELQLLPDRPVTVSLGVIEAGHSFSLDQLVSRVDGALYAAKHQGRNRVCVAGSREASCSTTTEKLEFVSEVKSRNSESVGGESIARSATA